MKVNFTHPSGIFYNSLYNTKKNNNAQVPQLVSYTKKSFLNGLSALQNYNLSFIGKTTPRAVIAIDRDMKCYPFSSANKAGTTLGIATPRILKCLAEDEDKRAKYAGDYCFALESEVQTTKEDGTTGIDEEKIKQIFETAEIARTDGANVKKRRFYGMNKDIKPIPFESYAEAEKVTSASRPNIIKCLNGSNKTAGGYIFFEPEEIEIIDDAGKIDFDKEKLNLLIKRAEEYLSNPYIAEKMPIYAFYIGAENKKDMRFNTITEAISELKISHRSINACLSGENKFASDYCFSLANEIETTKEDGTAVKNEALIKKLKEEAKIERDANTSVRGKAIYALRIEDNFLERYDKSADAAKILKISPANISTCLAGRQKSAGGFIFLPAHKIEIKSKQGILIPDEEKLKTALKELDESVAANQVKRAAKRKKGGVEKAKTSEAETETTPEKNKADKNKSYSNLHKITCLYLKTHIPTPIMDKFKILGRIYAYKSNGDYSEYKDIFEASEKLDTDPFTLYNAIQNNSDKINGLVFTTDSDY